MLTAQEVYQVLRDFAMASRPMQRVTNEHWNGIYCGLMTVDVEGWMVTLFIDCGDLDYCDSCLSPEGMTSMQTTRLIQWDFYLTTSTVSLKNASSDLTNSSNALTNLLGRELEPPFSRVLTSRLVIIAWPTLLGSRAALLLWPRSARWTAKLHQAC